MLGAIVEFRVPLTIAEPMIPAGAAVTMSVWIDDANTGVYNPAAYPRGVSEDHPWSVTLPMDSSAGGDVLEQELAPGDETEFAMELIESTNATSAFNWSRTSDGPVQIDYAASLAAGNASVAVVDGANATVLDVALEAGDANDTVVVEEAAAGNWTITVSFTGAIGNVSMSIQPFAPPSPAAVGPGDDGNATVDNGTALGNQTADDGAFGIPGFELAALVAAGAIAVAASAARRRR
jgi:hypothetical protein